MATLSNFSWQTVKKRPNRSIKNGDMVDEANRSVVSELSASDSNILFMLKSMNTFL